MIDIPKEGQFTCTFVHACTICSFADDADEEAADQLEMSGSSTPMVTSQPPPDPTKGLPQLFRSRRLSSDFSISKGTMLARTPGNGAGMPIMPTAVESGTSDNNSGTGVVATCMGEKKALVTEGGKMLSASVVVQKLNVFDVAFSKKLESQGRQQKPVEQVEQAQPTGQTEGTIDTTTMTTSHATDEAPPTLTKPVKPDLPLAQSTFSKATTAHSSSSPSPSKANESNVWRAPQPKFVNSAASTVAIDDEVTSSICRDASNVSSENADISKLSSNENVQILRISERWITPFVAPCSKISGGYCSYSN